MSHLPTYIEWFPTGTSLQTAKGMISFVQCRCPVHDLPLNLQLAQQTVPSNDTIIMCADVQARLVPLQQTLSMLKVPVSFHPQPNVPSALLVQNNVNTPILPRYPLFQWQTPERMPISHPKPSHTYRALAVMAIDSPPHKMATAADICKYIAVLFPYYDLREKPWQNSIRHCLLRDNHFTKAPFTPKDIKQHCRNNYWVINPLSKMLMKSSYHRPHERRQTTEVESVSSQLQEVCIPNSNTSIIELVPSIVEKAPAICVLPHKHDE